MAKITSTQKITLKLDFAIFIIKYYVLWPFLDDLSTAGKFGLNKETKSKEKNSVCAKYHENYKYV